MNNINNPQIILSWICIIGGILLFALFAGEFFLRIAGAAIGLWLLSYGLGLQGKTFRGIYIDFKEKYKN